MCDPDQLTARECRDASAARASDWGFRVCPQRQAVGPHGALEVAREPRGGLSASASFDKRVRATARSINAENCSCIGSSDRNRKKHRRAVDPAAARAREPQHTDWRRIADLYGKLAALVRSPVVLLNRAVAVSMADGPAAGLALIDALSAAPSLQSYHLLPSARADVLHRLERFPEAQAEFERAAMLAQNARQRKRLLARAEACAQMGAKKG